MLSDFCLFPCEGSFCRDIGRECHIAALLDILYTPHTPQNTKKNTLQHTPHICRGESCQLFSKVILDNAVHVKFDTIRCAWQHPRKSLPDAEEFKNWKYFTREYLWQISQILLQLQKEDLVGACNSQQWRQFAFSFSNGTAGNTIQDAIIDAITLFLNVHIFL